MDIGEELWNEFFLDFFKDATVNGGAVVGFRCRHGGVDMAETVTEFQADGGCAGFVGDWLLLPVCPLAP